MNKKDVPDSLKRQQIQEGIKEKLLFDMKLVSPMVSKELEYNADQLAGEIISYLHSQGVCIKTEGEPPTVAIKNGGIWEQGYESGWADLRKNAESLGYTLTEPLIEEEQ